MMGDPIRDMFGREIRPGDKIVYAAADGRSAVLRRGAVEDVYWKDNGINRDDQPRVSVSGERLLRNWQTGAITWEPMYNRVSLSFPHRIIVVDRSAW